ncbi:histidine triad nucleotide-binding protein [Candidatus Cytomitobacter primus]|uniref:Histidine triad nucleotide-binding protein n=1 Tax=Candidatus Cytomitobacter primus TaxID=2066024 RepID=A0A5C0UFX8_9PROT|nr:histidine triad nucleotide-binding protein [Candidatus Cytomitobacter primus]QEK38627.1 histidine triad nucleotide-binding protein [Candidatus Cytomitobacter primus]
MNEKDKINSISYDAHDIRNKHNTSNIYSNTNNVHSKSIDNTYNTNNLFAKIIRKEIPSEVVYEDEHTLSFKDINPQAKIHILIIPKQRYCNVSDLLNGNKEFLGNFMLGVSKTIQKANPENKDFKLLTNNGTNAGQEIFHMHFHLLIN